MITEPVPVSSQDTPKPPRSHLFARPLIEESIWRRLLLPGCGLTEAADPVFGNGLGHRRLFPGGSASGHPAARAQAFLRARISAALFSRAIYGMSST